MSKFAEYSTLNLAQINKEILAMWDNKDIFHKSIEAREGCPSFVFYEGPPSANGMPGIHHVMARTIKDLFLRYKTMKGFKVERKAGWDTHGLPVELGVEKSLGITKEDIGKSISVEEYNATCRREVMKFTKEWEGLTHKMGYWVDMKDPYITYNNSYIETLWWLLGELYKKDLLYKGYSIQPYSPAAGTGLSTHELNQPGCYRDVTDTTVTAQFKVKGEENLYLIAWTTTPWTLPSNTALCVGPNIDYVKVATTNPYTKENIQVIVAANLFSSYFKDMKLPTETFKGATLVGLEYEQLMPFFKAEAGAFKVISGDFVTTEDGTGIVHIAPSFGADDARVAKGAGIPAMMLKDKNNNQRPMVDLQGRFFRLEDMDEVYCQSNVRDSYKEYAGRYVKNAYDTSLSDKDESLDVSLCMLLKQQGLAFKIAKHVHSYPHCWRTDKPVLYYPLDSWFIKSTAYRDEMMALNNTINWKPKSTGAGRFGKWLENLQDWSLSRSRYWGTPLPIWRTEDGTEEICINSTKELMTEIEKSIEAGVMTSNPYKNFKVGDFSAKNYDVKNIDLHRPAVDNIILVSSKGTPMQREKDLIDVWFDSGAMPYAQLHYPFENKTLIDENKFFPADFISEGVDQTRGWFFTLHAISSMVKGSVAFKNVISNGLVLDKKGNKMSKRLGNAADPFSTMEKYGSDPLRWYMMTNSAPWDNLKFNTDGIQEVSRKFFGTLFNTYSFFVLYANVDNFDGSQKEIAVKDRPEIDRWIISLLNTLIKEVDSYYDDYEPTKAGRAIANFVTENLSNWYVRLNRRRYWAGEMNNDKLAAFQTLYTCQEVLARLMAPIAPFMADKLFLDLNKVSRKDKNESVHLARFPNYDEDLIDKTLEIRMEMAQRITSMVLALRKKANSKVRQPLSRILIPSNGKEMTDNILSMQELLKNELNIKEIKIVDSSAGILVKRIKPNFKKLGPKCGKNMKLVAAWIQQLKQEEIVQFEKNGSVNCILENSTINISIDDVDIISDDIPGWLVSNEGSLTIALDITLTKELIEEGLAREIVNRIQNLRKTSGFEISDRIKVEISANEATELAIKKHLNHICTQVLATSFEIKNELTDGIESDIDEEKVWIKISKV